MHIPLSLRQLFALCFLGFIGLLAATALSAWTGPTATAPAGNVSAPINVGTADQVKDAGISVNSLAVFGSQYIQDKLGIGRVSPVTALDVNGTVRIADGGEVCQAVTAGSMRFNSSSVAMEYCDGIAWMRLSAVYAVSASAQNYTTAGTYTFTVPTYNTLVVTVDGACGGGGSSVGYNGAAGNLSKFSVAAPVQGDGGGGGYAPADSLYGVGVNGTNGGASGGETNTTGGSSCSGGAGGSYTYGTGGTGGKGGRAVKTWQQGAPGSPTIWQKIQVVVGAGGAGGASWGPGYPGGSDGQAGSVAISWY